MGCDVREVRERVERAAAEATERERVDALQRADELFRQLGAKRQQKYVEQRAAKKAKQQQRQEAASSQ